MPDTRVHPLEPTDESQELQMTQHAMSLMDVLEPPGNLWLKALSRRKADLPPGVYVVRFGGDDDDLTDAGPDEKGDLATAPAPGSPQGDKRPIAAAMEG